MTLIFLIQMDHLEDIREIFMKEESEYRLL